jgi:hypothetical protein
MINTLENNSETSKKVSAISGLSAKIVTALAALGIATSAEKVEGATVLIGGTLPNSTVSTPTLDQSVSGVSELHSTTP